MVRSVPPLQELTSFASGIWLQALCAHNIYLNSCAPTPASQPSLRGDLNALQAAFDAVARRVVPVLHEHPRWPGPYFRGPLDCHSPGLHDATQPSRVLGDRWSNDSHSELHQGLSPCGSPDWTFIRVPIKHRSRTDQPTVLCSSPADSRPSILSRTIHMQFHFTTKSDLLVPPCNDRSAWRYTDP